MTNITGRRWFRLVFCLMLIFTSQPRTNDLTKAQETSPPPASRELEIEEGRKLSLEVEELIDRGKFDEALLRATRVLEIREKVFGPEHPEVATSLGNAAYIFFRKKNYIKARDLFERALAIQEKAGLENQDTAKLLNNFGLLHYEEGDRNKAELLYGRALAILEKIPHGLENAKAANIITNLALVLYEKEDYKGAEQLYRRGLTILEERLGPESAKLIPTLNYFALVYLQTGRRGEAMGLFNRAVGLLEKNPEYDSSDALLVISNLLVLHLQDGSYAKAEGLMPRSLTLLAKNPGEYLDYKAVGYNALGQLQKAKGDYEKAESFYGRALEMLDKASLMTTAYAAEVLINLGSLYVEQGEYAKAKDLLERARAIRQNVLGTEHTNFATSLAYLADLSYRQGHYREAELTYKQVLEVYRKTLGELHPYTATVINNLGLISLMRGDRDGAEALFQQALKMREQVLPSGHEDIAASLTPLAKGYLETGWLDKAAAAFQRALTIYEQSRGPDDQLVARIVNDLGLVHYQKGEPLQAESLFRRALAITEKRFGKDNLNITPILNNLALVQEARGNVNEAAHLYKQALEIYEKLRLSNHPDLIRILDNFSTLSSEKGDIVRAVSLAERAAEVEEHYLTLMLAEGSESQNNTYWQTLFDSTAKKISLHTINSPNHRLAARLALTTVLRRKGRVLDAITDSIQALRADPAQANKDLLDKFTAARSRLAAAISGHSDGTETGGDPASVARLEEEYRRLEAIVISAGTGSRAPSQPVTIESIQKLIPVGAALVEIVVYKPFNAKAREVGQKWGVNHYVAYVLRRDGDVAWVDLGEAGDIHCQLWDLRAALRRPDATPDGKDVRALAREVDEWVMRPVRKLLGGTHQLFISPDLLLQTVPFEALLDEQGRYLVENYSFTYLNSARDLQRLQSHPPSRQSPIIIANPDFNKEWRAVKTLPPGGAGSRPQPARDRTTFVPLPATEEEARQIKKLLPGALIMKGPKATVTALKQVRGPSILHIATHGFFTSPKPPNLEVTKIDGVEAFKPCIQLLPLEFAQLRRGVNYELLLSQSGIALAGANKEAGADAEDGILTALEVGGLDLRGTKLVVLSACETAIGDVGSGNGVQGLRRALAVAGAESQVISLWKVNDDATRDLMIKFYTGVRAGKGRSDALREAKLGMLRSKYFSHPYFWASFIQSGDWRRIGTDLK